MRPRYDEIRRLGAEVLVVTLAPPDRLAVFLESSPWPFPSVCDPQFAAYRAFGLSRASWWSFARPGLILSYLKIMGKGRIPRTPDRGADLRQLGGDFVLDGRRRIVYALPSKDPADRPPPQALLDAVRRAAGTES